MQLEFSIVMPVFNEEGLIGATVESVMKTLDGESSFEVILVNDGSADRTWNRIQRLAEQYVQVKGIAFTRNFGHQAALMAGVSYASGQAVITMDSDGEHPATLLPRMLAAWRRGAKIVQGVRLHSDQLSLTKRFASEAFYRLFSWMAQSKIRPGSADFRLLDRDVVRTIEAHPHASGFLRGFIPWTGFPTEYIEYQQFQRSAGVSKFTRRKMIRLAKEGILGFSVKPLRAAMLIGILTCFVALINLIYTVAVRILSPEAVVPGWATVTSLLALLGGIQLLALGVIGEYIAMIFLTVRNQPDFIVGTTVGFDLPAQASEGIVNLQARSGP